MRWPIRISLMIAAIFSVSLLSFAQSDDYDRRPRTASIRGRVTIEGKPAAKVIITMTEDRTETREVRLASIGGRDVLAPSLYKAVTDSEGRYRIDGLPAGTYKITPKSMAYVPVSNFLGLGPAHKITLDEGEARETVDFSLVRGGVISGRVIDEGGQPQVGRFIRLTMLTEEGKPAEILDIFSRMLGTDDRGIYRIFGLRKGRYIVSAGGENDVLQGAIEGKKTQVTYHPDVIKPEEATAIEVAEGTETTGVDIKLRNPIAVETFTVFGRVIDSETRKPIPHVYINCFPVQNPDEESGNGVAYPLTDNDGNFTATGLKPGKYKAQLSPHPQFIVEHYSEGKYFEVYDADVSGVEVRARRGATINGMVVLEEGINTPSQASLSGVTLQAQVTQNYMQGYRLVGLSRTNLEPDGRFRLVGIHPGKMRLTLSSNSSEPYYLLRIERAGVAVGETMDVGAGEQVNDLRLIAARGRGVIRGSLKIVGGTLPEGSYLSVRVMREGTPQSGGSGEVDEKGRFLIRGLLTGEYALSISLSFKFTPPSDQYPTIPPLPRQLISVTNGAETEATITYDLSRKEQEK